MLIQIMSDHRLRPDAERVSRRVPGVDLVMGRRRHTPIASWN
jgi:hypothetical protein